VFTCLKGSVNLNNFSSMLYFGGMGRRRKRVTIILCKSCWEIPLHFLSTS